MSAPNRYFIVPPHLLKQLAGSTKVPHQARQVAQATLDHHAKFTARRLAYQEASGDAHRGRPSIIPGQLFKAIAESDDVDDETRASARRDLAHLVSVQDRIGQGHDDEAQKQVAGSARSGSDKTAPLKVYRVVADAKHTEDEDSLPGPKLRVEGQKPSSDEAANEVYDNFDHVEKFYYDIFQYKSLDNKNMPVVGSVHFSTDYQNAFWDSTVAQMVFGDGAGFIGNFTRATDVIGHEMTHAVTEHTCNLNYQGESGALNEHLSDAFGIMIKQRKDNQTAAESDWLIGEDCLMPGVKGVALRSMKAPGTAYDDPRFGTDPQPDNYSQYVAMDDDNGGVHIYSGIPNKAFYLCATKFGGYSWEKAGLIWWKVMTGGKVSANSDFRSFAKLTVEAAKATFDADAAKLVQEAWENVGVSE